jgi:uncharacterized protein (DUF1499 family)
MEMVLIAKYVLLVLVATGIGTVLAVRFSRDDPARWHVDPLAAVLSGKPNQYVLGPEKSPVFAVDAISLAQAFDDMAMAQPRVERLAGSVGDLWLTYVQKSALIGYPDYISVKFIDTPDGSATLAVFSRSRYGHSDLGVNQGRIKSWVKALGEGVVAR